MSTSPKPFAFVLMPFDPTFDDAYQLAIRPACEAAGAYAERVDQQIFSGNIMERVYNQIAKADVIVADMSGRNANVFYEVGYAHALGKTTILITGSEADIPFDLRQYPHIIYGESLSSLKTELERRVRWHLENPASVAAVAEELDIRLDGRQLTKGDLVEIAARGEPSYVGLHFAVQNRAEHKIRSLDFRVGLAAPLRFDKATNRAGHEYECTVLENCRIFMFPEPIHLLPSEWVPFEFRIQSKQGHIAAGDRLELMFHAYFDSGAVTVAFDVLVKSM